MGEESKRIVGHFSPENAAGSIYQACGIALNRKKKAISG